MARRRQIDMTDKERAEIERKRLEFYAECVEEPMKFVFHDVNAHDDPKLQDLRDDHGFEALGRWWLLVELLASREGHAYDVSRKNGWRRLAQDLEYGRANEEECQDFIEVLAGLGLLNTEAFERGEVRSARIDSNASDYARNVADKRLGAWLRWRKKQDKDAAQSA